MEREDIFQKQIEQLGQFFTRVISKITGKQTASEIKMNVEAAKAELKNAYKIDIDGFKEISSDELLYQLKCNSQFSFLNMEYLADLIEIVAEQESNSIHQQDYLVKSLAIHLHLDKTQKTYSEERNQKINRIRSKFEP